MAANTQYEVATWNQIYDMLLDLANKIQGDGYKPDVIIGIARGGLVPARILSDFLETPELAIIQIEYYVSIAQTRQEPILKRSLHTQITDKKALLVDDVSDTGKSLQLAKNHLQQQGAKEIKTATLYAKPETITKPDYCEKQTSHWIVFPWDAKETVRKIIQKQEGKRATSKEIAKLVKAGLPKQLAEKFLKDMH
ncbi:MAG: phosphoribosyltransferase [Candidatus Bathyarchaeota archaeon]|nr:phosphoribosyltransferase [Candidatus Bathyarchaeota archaeon]